MSRLKYLILFLFFTIFFGCAQQEIVKCNLPQDNPEHHYLVGMRAIEERNINLAIEKFERALYCDEKFSRAYSGVAIAKAENAKTIKDAQIRKIELDRVEKDLKQAKKYAETVSDEFDYYLAKIRVYTAFKTKDWLQDAEKAYFNAVDLKIDETKLTYYEGKEAAHYFIGLAYMDSFDFEKAKDKFRAVLNSKKTGKWHEKAEKAWKKADKITRAMAGITVGDVGKKIAVQDTITRADLSALLVSELRIDSLFAGRIPVESQLEKIKPEFIPADIINNPFREEILTVLKWKIRGLEPKYHETVKAYLFKPEEVVKRGEMALILEDVIIKLTADEKIATAFFGHEKSPFPDVRVTSPIYNAVMNMTTRGIMEAEDISGEFRPDNPVTGADAILAIRVLKQRIILK